MNTTALIGLFVIALYGINSIKEFIKAQFLVKDDKTKYLVGHIELLFIVPLFITVLVATVILTTADVGIQNRLLISWMALGGLFISPMIVLLFASLVRAVFKSIRDKNNNEQE